jgi:hypothetical protein
VCIRMLSQRPQLGQRTQAPGRVVMKIINSDLSASALE